MRVVIYSRYSSEMQRAESCEDQEREVRKGLDRLAIDHSSALALRDEAQSGTTEAREAYDQIVQRIRNGEKMVLAVDDQSRLSRGDNVKGLIRDLVFAGGRFVSTGEGIDTEQAGWELRVPECTWKRPRRS